MATRGGDVVAEGPDAEDAGFLNTFDYPSFALRDEPGHYVRYGLTPAQALASAAISGPRWLSKGDRYGAVAAGKAADLVLLDADPLADIAATRKVRAVVLRGRLLDRAALDGMLAEIKAKVAAWKPDPCAGALVAALTTRHPSKSWGLKRASATGPRPQLSPG